MTSRHFHSQSIEAKIRFAEEQLAMNEVEICEASGYDEEVASY